MTRLGLKAAFRYGEKLTAFKSMEEAEKYFFTYKDKLLGKFEKKCAQYNFFTPDYSVESLKKLEKIYFDLYDAGSFRKTGLSREEFESAMSIYFGEVVVRNNDEAKFEVREFPFAQGKYEFYISKGLLSVAIADRFHDLYKQPSNVRKNHMYREYNRYFK